MAVLAVVDVEAVVLDAMMPPAELTPMQTARSCVPERPANRPASQLLPIMIQGFQAATSATEMPASWATWAQVVSKALSQFVSVSGYKT